MQCLGRERAGPSGRHAGNPEFAEGPDPGRCPEAGSRYGYADLRDLRGAEGAWGAGLLQGHTATCYPGIEEYLTGAKTTKHEVEVSGQFVTSRGVGTAIPFALKIIELLKGKEQAEKMKNSIVFNISL